MMKRSRRKPRPQSFRARADLNVEFQKRHAPAWAPEALDLKGRDAGRGDKLEHGSSIAIGAGGRLFYLEGYRDGSEETRVKLLADAIEAFAARRD